MPTNATVDSQTLKILSALNVYGLCSLSEHCRTLRSIAHEPAMSKVESHVQNILQSLTDLLDELVYVHDQLYRLKQQLPMRERILNHSSAQRSQQAYRTDGLLSQLDTLEKTLWILDCSALTRQAVRFLRHIEIVCKSLITLRNEIIEMLAELNQTSTLLTAMSYDRITPNVAPVAPAPLMMASAAAYDYY